MAIEEVKVDQVINVVKVDGSGQPISPGFYITTETAKVDRRRNELLRVCKANDVLWFDRTDGCFGLLSECNDDCLKGWTRVQIIPGIGSGLNYY